MSRWTSTLVGPEASLEEAMRVLDGAGMRIALVVDAERRLLGTLTDGDVRRALLRRVPLSAPVTEVMHRDSRVAERGWSRERIRAVLQSTGVLQLPVVDEAGRVVDLETVAGQLESPRHPNVVFLMAGGLGKRLQPLTDHTPKPLLRIAGKPILESILERFVAAGFHRFFISTHYLPEQVREHFGDGSRWGVSIRYTHEPEPLGTGGALGLLPHDEIREPLFLMNGDLVTSLDYARLLEFHLAHAAAATMCVGEYEHQVPYGVIQNEGVLIRSMVEKPTEKYFINAGIYVLAPELVRRVAPGTRIDMPTLLQGAIAAGQDVAMFPLHEYWLDVGRMEDFRRAQREMGDADA
jgi:dTDP-glucose pyrophosphorylase